MYRGDDILAVRDALGGRGVGLPSGNRIGGVAGDCVDAVKVAMTWANAATGDLAVVRCTQHGVGAVFFGNDLKAKALIEVMGGVGDVYA